MENGPKQKPANQESLLHSRWLQLFLLVTRVQIQKWFFGLMELPSNIYSYISKLMPHLFNQNLSVVLIDKKEKLF